MSRNFKLLIAIVAAVVLAVITVITFMLWQDNRVSVEDMQVTNISSTSFSLVWRSTTPYSAEAIAVPAGSGNLPALKSGLLADDRNRDGDKTAHYTHHVTFSNLDPEQDYQIRIGKQNFSHLVSELSVKTLPLEETISEPNPIYGKVNNSDNDDTVLVFNQTTGSEAEIRLVSTFLSNAGSYVIDSQQFGGEITKAQDLSVRIYNNATSPVLHTFTEPGLKPLEIITLADSASELLKPGTVGAVPTKFPGLVAGISAAGGQCSRILTLTSNTRTRTGPGTEFPTAQIFPVGDSLTTNCCAAAADGNIWFKLTDGNYVLASLFNSPPTTATCSDGTPSTPTPTPTPTTGTGSTAYSCTGRGGNVQYRAAANLNIRGGSSTTTEILGGLATGAEIEGCLNSVTGELGASSSNQWVIISYGNRAGYVSAPLLQKVVDESSTGETENTTPAESAPDPIDPASLQRRIICENPNNGNTIVTVAANCPNGYVEVAPVTVNQTGDWVVELAAPSTTDNDSTPTPSGDNTCPDGSIVSGAGKSKAAACDLIRAVNGGASAIPAYFSPACTSLGAGADTVDPVVGETPRKICSYLNISSVSGGSCTTGGWGTQGYNPCLRQYISSNINKSVLIFFSNGHSSVGNFRYIFPEELIENQYGKLFEENGYQLTAATNGTGNQLPRVVYEMLTAGLRCITDGSQASYSFNTHSFGNLPRNTICDYVHELYQNQRGGCDETGFRQLATAKSITASGRNCVTFLQQDLISYSTAQAAPILSGLLPNIFAAEATSQVTVNQDSVTLKTAGKYKFAGENGNERKVVVNMGENNTAQIKLFVDENDNGVKDDGEKFVKDHAEFTVSQESSLTNYQLNAGWNIVALDSNASLTAADLYDRASSSGLNPRHIGQYRQGKFELYTVRPDTAPFGNNFALVPGQGYFIYVEKSGELGIEASKITSSVPVDFESGWNLVGIVGTKADLDSQKLQDHAATQSLQLDTISRMESGVYQSVIFQAGDRFGNNFPITRTRGYFVRVNGEGKTYTPE